MKQKILLLCVMSALMLSFARNIVHAQSAKQSHIPMQMQPNTIIEFTSETEYKIIQGGEYEGEENVIDSAENSAARAASKCGCGKAVIEEETVVVGTRVWGSHLNTVIQTKSKTYGEGRFTTFRDSYGNHNNLLESGDVATCWHADNPDYKALIFCKVNGNTNWMHKADVGCLPDAALDVWYKGVKIFDKNASEDPGVNYSFKGISTYCHFN